VPSDAAESADRHAKEEQMTDVAKKGVTLLVIAFAAFYLLTQPEDAAGAIKTALDAVVGGLKAIARFFTALGD
jgi:hypothetical protein